MPDAGAAMAALHEAFVHEGRGEYDRALAKATAAFEGFHASSDRTGSAASLHLMGVLETHRGNLEQALAHFDAAVPLRESTGDTDGLAALLDQRFAVAVQLGRAETIEAAAQALLAKHVASGSREGEALARHKMAMVLTQAGRFEDAQLHIDAGFLLCDRAGEEKARTGFLVLSSRVAQAAGNAPRALSVARQALQVGRTASDRRLLVEALSHLASQVAPFDGAEARRHLEEALDGTELLREPALKAVLLQQLAEVELALGLHPDAIGRLRYAAKTWQELGEVGEQLEALHAAGELASQTNNHAEAVAIGVQQQRVAAALEDPGMLGAARFATAQRRIAAGDLEGAAADFRASAEAWTEPASRGVARANLGQVLAALGRRSEARAVLAEAAKDLDGTPGAQEIAGLMDQL